MRKKKGPSKKALGNAIVKMAAKASELDWSPRRPADEVQKAIDEPKFVYVKLDRVWGPWKRRGGAGNNGGFALIWGAEKVGFGEITFCFEKDGRVVCDTECMGGEKWAKAILAEFLKNVVYDPPGKPL
jgi:hypothetical protein